MNFWLYIPGFRSGVLWKKVIAILYYISSIYFFIHSWCMIMLFLTLPFTVFSFLDILVINHISHGDIYIFIISLILLIISVIGIFKSQFNIGIKSNKNNRKKSNLNNPNLLKVHFLNVGQADSILIQLAGESLLIDTGYYINGLSIVKYLKEQGIEELKYLVITHPHPDHIGGLPFILKHIPVNKVIMSKSKFPVMRNQKMNDKALAMLKEKNIPIIHPKIGNSFKIGNGKLIILAPKNNKYERVNNYSIVSKFVYGETSYLFPGDAEIVLEEELINSNLNLSSDVLKVSHHGSCTSSSEKFIKAISPKYAVISVGINSIYGQPDKCVLDRLKRIGSILYRTDKRGTIVSVSNGNKIYFNTDSCSYPRTKIFHTSVRKKYRALYSNKNW